MENLEWISVPVMFNHGPQLPAFSLAGGIVIASFTSIAWWTGIIVASASVLLYAALLRASGNPVRAFRLNKWHTAWIILLFAGIGIIDQGLQRPTDLILPQGDTDKASYVRCEVKDVLTRSSGDRLEAEILGTNGAKARILSGATDVAPGDIVMIPASHLLRVDADTTAFGRRLAPVLKARGILYSGRVPARSIEKTGRSASPRYFFTDIRNRIEIKLEKSHLERSTVRFINAILMGDRTGLDEQTRLTFARGGTAHALALSGMHLAIIAGFLMMLIWPAKLAGKYKWGYGAAILLLWMYVLVTGMANSSVRAAIMITLAFSAVMLERKNSSKDALWAACLIILIFDPSALFDAGFQLSVT
ncbi:MAG: ComEC/Rec2 family competence protein, partial [Muribaculaceae bacterium]|nr:ComEC/Rec2 family competence protein [Muribaculaceae bacterium]